MRLEAASSFCPNRVGRDHCTKGRERMRSGIGRDGTDVDAVVEGKHAAWDHMGALRGVGNAICLLLINAVGGELPTVLY